MEYSNNLNDVYDRIKEHNPRKERKVLMVFDGLIFDVTSNKKHNPVVTELFNRGKKLNVCFLSHNHTSRYQRI